MLLFIVLFIVLRYGALYPLCVINTQIELTRRHISREKEESWVTELKTEELMHYTNIFNEFCIIISVKQQNHQDILLYANISSKTRPGWKSYFIKIIHYRYCFFSKNTFTGY